MEAPVILTSGEGDAALRLDIGTGRREVVSEKPGGLSVVVIASESVIDR